MNSIKRWKYRSRELLKAILFLSPKKKKKIISGKAPHQIFFNSQFNCAEVFNKMANEYTVDYHPSLSGFTFKVHPLIFLQTP